MREKLFQFIQEYDIITIFHHVNADGDALGSQHALRSWILEQYPDKKVYALGDDNSSLVHLFPKHDVVADELIENSLALIVDTSTKERINDKRALKAKVTFRIDHHIDTEQFTDYAIIESSLTSTCELVATLLKEQTKKPLSKTVSRYLYYGLITDTVGYTITSVSSETFMIAAYLLESGLNVSEINRELYAMNQNLFKFRAYLMENVIFKEKVAYIKINQEDIRRFNITSNEAKECITIFNAIEGIYIWGLLVEDEKLPNIYNISLRAYQVPINELAMKYGGGGHRFAVGIKGLTEEQWQSLLTELINTSKKNGR